MACSIAMQELLSRGIERERINFDIPEHGEVIITVTVDGIRVYSIVFNASMNALEGSWHMGWPDHSTHKRDSLLKKIIRIFRGDRARTTRG